MTKKPNKIRRNQAGDRGFFSTWYFKSAGQEKENQPEEGWKSN